MAAIHFSLERQMKRHGRVAKKLGFNLQGCKIWRSTSWIKVLSPTNFPDMRYELRLMGNVSDDGLWTVSHMADVHMHARTHKEQNKWREEAWIKAVCCSSQKEISFNQCPYFMFCEGRKWALGKGRKESLRRFSKALWWGQRSAYE